MEVLEEIKKIYTEIKSVENKISSLEELDYDKLHEYSKELFELKIKLQRLENTAYLGLKPDYESSEIDLYIKNLHDTMEESKPDKISYFITIHGSKEKIGEIEVRYSLLESEKYLGNIGANINPEYRGNKYVKKAFHLLKESMIENGLSKPIFTVRIDNYSSINALRNIDAKRIDYVDGENPYYVYEYDLEKENNKNK